MAAPVFPAKAFPQRGKLSHKLLPQFINLLQFLLGLDAPPPHPGLLPVLKAPDSLCQNIILQKVHLLHVPSAKAAPKVAQRSFIRKILLDQKQRLFDKFRHGVKHNIFSGIQKQGNLICIKNFIGIISIQFHIAAHNGNVLVTVLLLPHQSFDFPGGKMKLLSGI